MKKFKEKRMASYVLRSNELIQEGKTKEAAELFGKGLGYYSSNIIHAITPYATADAADDVDEETKEIKIIRSGKLYFAFSVHALSDDDMYEIRKKYTKYAKNKRTGMKVTDGMDNAKFRSSLIYNAKSV